MSVVMKLEVKGTDKLLKLSRLSSAIIDIKNAVGKAVAMIEKEVKPLTPIDKGILRSSTFHYVSGLTGYVVNPTPYAVYVHEGTAKWPLSRAPKNPHTVRQFLNAGAEKAKPAIDDIFEKMLASITTRITK